MIYIFISLSILLLFWFWLDDAETSSSKPPFNKPESRQHIEDCDLKKHDCKSEKISLLEDKIKQRPSKIRLLKNETENRIRTIPISKEVKRISTQEVYVFKVIDGDSILADRRDIDSSPKKPHRIRLYGIDAPEKDQPFGTEATEFASDLVLRKRVFIKIIDNCIYDRDVALIQLSDGRILNEELLRSGLAWVYEEYCDKITRKRWKAIETQAQLEKRGLFRDKEPIEPWIWRQSS